MKSEVGEAGIIIGSYKTSMESEIGAQRLNFFLLLTHIGTFSIKFIVLMSFWENRRVGQL